MGNHPACALAGTGFAALSQVRAGVGKHPCGAFTPGAEIVDPGCLVGFISPLQVTTCLPGAASAPLSSAALAELCGLGGINAPQAPFPASSLWLSLGACGRKSHPELSQIIVGTFFSLRMGECFSQHVLSKRFGDPAWPFGRELCKKSRLELPSSVKYRFQSVLTDLEDFLDLILVLVILEMPQICLELGEIL